MFVTSAEGVVTTTNVTRTFRVTKDGVTRTLLVDFTENRTTEVSEEALIELIYNLNNIDVQEIA